MDQLVSTPDLRTASSILMDRARFLRQAGMSFNGARDLYTVLGYDRQITSQMYRDRYARGGIAGRIVEALPRATWKGGWELIEDENPDVSTRFELDSYVLADRLKMSSIFLKTDILAGLGTYSVLLIGAPGDVSQELPRGNADSIAYLSPFAEADATIQSWDSDIQSPRFGLPTSYMLRRTDITTIGLQKPVHWSRVVHVAEDSLENNVYGQPALERVWNLLDDLDKVIGGGAEAFWLRANAGLQLDYDPTMTPQPSDAEKADLRAQAEDYQHQMRRMLRTRGVTINPLGSDVANFGPPADAIMTQIAGAKGIPKRILTGSEQGELASSQDRDNWDAQVMARRENHAIPNLVRATIGRFIAYDYLPTPKEYSVLWPKSSNLTETEKADGSAKWANTNHTNGSTVFTSDEIRDHFYGLQPLEPGQIVTAPTPTPRAAEDADMLSVLEAAIVAGDFETIRRLVMVSRA